jgi:superoxide dismutase, Cu-Zn family
MIRTAVVTTGLAAAAALAVTAPAVAEDVARSSGALVRYPQADAAANAPEGARARVQSVETADGRTVVTLHVSGMEPHARYGVHAHVSPCGSTGGAAGPHFQHVVDPVSPSVDPAYANPHNEVWLDLTTNRAGEGRAKTVLDWQFSPTRRPASVILHERHTATAPGVAGTAGKRVACLTVPF